MKQLVSTGSASEVELGFSRAVVAGGLVHVAGCSGLRRDSEDGSGGAVQQFHAAVEKIAGVLAQVGCTLDDVVRTRVYLTDPDDFEALGSAHGAVFGAVRPASTMVQVGRLVDRAMLVEVEATALVPDVEV